MAESLEIWDGILRDWAKDKAQKSLVEAFNRYEKQEQEGQSQEEEMQSRFFFRKWLRKSTWAVSIGKQTILLPNLADTSFKHMMTHLTRKYA